MRALRNPATSKGSRISRPSSERSSSGIHTNKEWSSTTQRWRGEPTSMLALSRALGLDLKGEKGENIEEETHVHLLVPSFVTFTFP